MLTQALEKQYICPGESRPITRAVHLSRMAAFFPACRECPCRHDAGPLALAEPSLGDKAKELSSPSTPGPERIADRRTSIFDDDGVRGVWLNEITRAKASEIAAAFAALLWEQQWHRSEGATLSEPVPTEERRSPLIVVGHDDRPSAPEVITSAAASLRRMGCEVVDTGLTTRPCLAFAVHHLGAAGGVLVSGAGRPPSWTGLDFFGPAAVPLSRVVKSTSFRPGGRLTLSALEARAGQPASRPTRGTVPQRTFSWRATYEQSLRKHFHALRPLTVCCGSPLLIVRQTLEQLFAALPCRLRWIDLPRRMRNPADPKDADLVRMGDFVRAEQGHLGFLVDDDGQRCGFVDEHGDAVAPGVMARLLVEGELSEHPRAAVVEAEPATVLRAAVERRAGRLVMAEATSQSVWTAMEREGAVLGGCDGRLWFRDEGPVCDAVITLARTLDLLSRSDRPLSEIAALDLEDAVAEPADSNAAQHGIAATKVAGTLPLRVPSAEQAIDPRSCTNHSADGTRRGSVPATLPGSTANSLRTQ